MIRRSKRRQGKGAMDLMEEAVALLRSAPAAVLVSYYLGALPFYLGILYFWTDMARSPFAHSYLPQAAFGVCLLFLWMKVWHAVFAAGLRAHIGGAPSPSYSARRMARIALQQSAWQPFGLFAIPVSLLLFLPFGWVYAYYQNLSCAGDGEQKELSAVSRQAWTLAGLWSGQNHLLISIAWVLWGILFLNVMTVLLVAPQLLKMLFGIETVFTMSGMAILNSTFFAIVVCVTQLCLNPLMKAVYVLRCFYGESLQSGADLKAELREAAGESMIPRASILAGLVLLAALLGGSNTAIAAEAPQPVSPQQLDETIERVIHEREFQWRVPRQKDPEQERSAIIEFIRGVRDWVVRVTQPVRDLWRRFIRWLRRTLFKSPSGGTTTGSALSEEQLSLLLILLAVAAAILGVFLWRIWRRKKQPAAEVEAQPVTVLPDLQDENLVADQLPEDEWQSLAADLMQRGELRLAMRALYMASLAFLAGRRLITIARFKSNRDYQRELVRRAREREALLSAFADNISMFERVWYGTHDVTSPMMDAFDINHDRIRTLAQE